MCCLCDPYSIEFNISSRASPTLDPFVASWEPFHLLPSPLRSPLAHGVPPPPATALFPSYAACSSLPTTGAARPPTPLPRNRLKRVKADKMIGVGKAKQYANVLDKPLSRGRQEVRAVPAPNSLQIYTRTAALDPCSWCRSSSGGAFRCAGKVTPSSSLLSRRLC